MSTVTVARNSETMSPELGLSASANASSWNDLAQENIQLMMLRDSGRDLIGSQWELKKTIKGTEFRVGTVPGIAWTTLKATSMVRAPRNKVKALLMDITRAREIDETVKSIRLVEEVDQDTQIRHAKGVSFPLISARDFLVLTRAQDVDDKTSVIASRSIEDERVPEENGFVRGHAFILGYVLRDVEEEEENREEEQENDKQKKNKSPKKKGDSKRDASGPRTEVSLVIHFDLKGRIPAAALTFVGVTGPNRIMIKLKKAVEES